MWVFGYGSLMWDGWEIPYAGRQTRASLEGYRRIFNKPSVKRWGSATHPGPTLNLEAIKGARCEGIAFAFDADQAAAVRAYLRKREGSDFPLRTLPVRLANGTSEDAEVPIYVGQVLPSAPISEMITRIRAATGSAGSCEQYVRAIVAELDRLEIEDPVVIALANALHGRS